MDNILEFFSIPINLEEINVFGSVKMYTSDNLKRKYIEAISQIKKSVPISESITKMVDEGVIIPCYMRKGIIQYIISKMGFFEKAITEDELFKREVKYSAALYEPTSNKVLVLIDNNLHFLTYVSNDDLASFTIHESMHMFAHRKPEKFMSNFKNILNDFYHLLFSRVFSLKKGQEIQKRCSEILDFLFQSEIRLKFNKSFFNQYEKLLRSLIEFSKLDKKEFLSRLHLFLTAIYIYSKSQNTFINNSDKFLPILGTVNLVYDTIFGEHVVSNIPIQELMFPSEVISISSELKSNLNKIYSAFRQLS